MTCNCPTNFETRRTGNINEEKLYVKYLYSCQIWILSCDPGLFTTLRPIFISTLRQFLFFVNNRCCLLLVILRIGHLWVPNVGYSNALRRLEQLRCPSYTNTASLRAVTRSSSAHDLAIEPRWRLKENVRARTSSGCILMAHSQHTSPATLILN